MSVSLFVCHKLTPSHVVLVLCILMMWKMEGNSTDVCVCVCVRKGGDRMFTLVGSRTDSLPGTNLTNN